MAADEEAEAGGRSCWVGPAARRGSAGGEEDARFERREKGSEGIRRIGRPLVGPWGWGLGARFGSSKIFGGLFRGAAC